MTCTTGPTLTQDTLLSNMMKRLELSSSATSLPPLEGTVPYLPSSSSSNRRANIAVQTSLEAGDLLPSTVDKSIQASTPPHLTGGVSTSSCYTITPTLLRRVQQSGGGDMDCISSSDDEKPGRTLPVVKHRKGEVKGHRGRNNNTSVNENIKSKYSTDHLSLVEKHKKKKRRLKSKSKFVNNDCAFNAMSRNNSTDFLLHRTGKLLSILLSVIIAWKINLIAVQISLASAFQSIILLKGIFLAQPLNEKYRSAVPNISFFILIFSRIYLPFKSIV